ncbi:AAA family ATPase [Pseudomonas protegens]|uniref:DUF4435 domain-containing protein n=1 Tax=Pseudomonas protegens TaxID=380021 RepID=UPI00287F276E|nr:DUF4435 domain-containing protein [Pseudomonas protegens]MDS9874481.1 AAA family ATPase [Pseudomonas protegens]
MSIDQSEINAAELEQQRRAERAQAVHKKTIHFPGSVSKPDQTTELTCQTSIVVIGPNGAGKSRLGAWMEMEGPQKDRIHRIAAQRSLVFPESSSPIGIEAARESFHWAKIPANWDRKTFENNKVSLRLKERYGGEMTSIVTAPLNDIGKLLTLLFSDNYNALLKRENEELQTKKLVAAPETLLRKVQSLWEAVLPHRKLEISSGDIRAKSIHSADGTIPTPYHAKAMSDGERVVFYLIGQCLCAPPDAIILVDEPEIHLHKAIQDALWNSIEKARPDCTFVYLTHDLSFAADRVGAIKICLTDFTNDQFSWFAVEPQQEIPAEIYLEVLGSRKPVLFVEGTAGSIDLELYQLAFPNFTVKPAGGCASVLSATKAFKDLSDLHHLHCFGLIDRDYLDAGQIESYSRSGVYTPLVAEVENLFLVPELISAVAEQLMLSVTNVLKRVEDFVIDMFQRDIESHAMDVMHQRVTLALGRFSSNAKSVSLYSSDFKTHVDKIDAKLIYDEAIQEAQYLIDTRDYRGILRVFNRKGISEQIAHLFEVRRGTYIEKVRELSKRGLGDIPGHLRRYLPDLDLYLDNPVS